MPPTDSAALRQRLGHPVIDADGHMIEVLPVLFDFLKQVGGPDMAERTWKAFQGRGLKSWYEMSEAERRHHRVLRPAFWAAPAENTLDRATAMLPRLMHERLPEMGIDYAVVYPTIGFLLPDLPDKDIRLAACRAHNLMVAELYRGLEDRLTPAAVIPCYTPGEAIVELDFALGELGLKVPMLSNLVKRPVPAAAELHPEAGRYATWVDTLALDSEHDYDPLWQRCVDLKVPVTAHAVGQGIGTHRSVSSYMYNQTGHFAMAGHAFAKALFFGGVTHRFPALNFAFLECGVAWGASLVCDLVERFEKRGPRAIGTLDPARVDTLLMDELFARYGGDLLRPPGAGARRARPEAATDDFAAAGVTTIEELLDRLVPRYYYGCEADDRMNATAFDARLLPGGHKLNAIFSSDFGHWDVADMRGVLCEAYELVEDGLIGEADFRAFVFDNPARLFMAMDPDFFAGTAVADDVARLPG